MGCLSGAARDPVLLRQKHDWNLGQPEQGIVRKSIAKRLIPVFVASLYAINLGEAAAGAHVCPYHAAAGTADQQGGHGMLGGHQRDETPALSDGASSEGHQGCEDGDCACECGTCSVTVKATSVQHRSVLVSPTLTVVLGGLVSETEQVPPKDRYTLPLANAPPALLLDA